MRRPAAKLKITQTDAEPTGSAPLGSSAVGLRRSTHIAEIFQTDVEPAGPTPLETSDVEQEVLSLQRAKKQKKDADSSMIGEQTMAQEDECSSGRNGKSLSMAMTPTSSRRGSRVAETAMKRPA